MFTWKNTIKCAILFFSIISFIAFPNHVIKAGTGDFETTKIIVNGDQLDGSVIDVKSLLSEETLNAIYDENNTDPNVVIAAYNSEGQMIGEQVTFEKSSEKWMCECPDTAGIYTFKFRSSADSEEVEFPGSVEVTVEVITEDHTVSCGEITSSTKLDMASLTQTVTLTVGDINATAGVGKVEFVISNASGEPALTAEGTASEDGKYSVTVDAKKLTPKYGTFTAKAVVTDVYGNSVGSDNVTSFKLVASKGSITVTADNKTGTILVKTNKIYSADEIDRVRFKVWTQAGGEENPVRFTATANGDGTYSYTVNASKFKYYNGKYHVKAYIKFKNGKESVFVTDKQTSLSLKNFIVYGKTSETFYKKFYIYYPTVKSNVKAVLWSKVGAGKDKKTYTATYDSANKRLVVKAKMSLLKGPGECYLQLKDKAGKSIKKYTFNVDISEIVKTGWHYTKLSDGRTYKLYFKNGKAVNDLTKILKLKKNGKLRAEVNRKKCRVVIYAYDSETKSWCIPVIEFKCSPGLAKTPTPVGTFKTSDKYRWHTLMGPSYGQYCTRIVKGILFHSVAGKNRTVNNLSAYSYNKLGSPASHGCVRLTVRDAKWIYDYCNAGMQVKIFDGSFEGPLTPQVVPKMLSTQNYDPTDPLAPKSKYNTTK